MFFYAAVPAEELVLLFLVYHCKCYSLAAFANPFSFRTTLAALIRDRNISQNIVMDIIKTFCNFS